MTSRKKYSLALICLLLLPALLLIPIWLRSLAITDLLLFREFPNTFAIASAAGCVFFLPPHVCDDFGVYYFPHNPPNVAWVGLPIINQPDHWLAIRGSEIGQM